MPLYHQVYVVLRQRIRNNEFDPRSRCLASTRWQRNSASRASPSGAHSSPSNSTAWSSAAAASAHLRCRIRIEFRDRYNIGGLLRAGARHDAPTESRNLRIATLDPPAHVVQKFGSAEQVLLIERLRHIRDEPFNLLTIYLPEWVAGRSAEGPRER